MMGSLHFGFSGRETLRSMADAQEALQKVAIIFAEDLLEETKHWYFQNFSTFGTRVFLG